MCLDISVDNTLRDDISSIENSFLKCGILERLVYFICFYLG